MNTKGNSFVETLLTILIIFTVAGSLIPLSYHMKTTLYKQKLELHASETALLAAKLMKNQSIRNGYNVIENVEYYWTYDNQKICVEYNNLTGVSMKCINQNGESY